MVAVEKTLKSFQNVGRDLKDHNDINNLAFQQNEKKIRYASERLRKINIQS